MSNFSVEAWIIGALLVVIAGLWIRLRQWANRGHVRAVRRARRAGAGERTAERVLEEAGYAVLERQVRCIWWIDVDGREEEVELRADLLVERDGERFVAEVKTGAKATDPTFPPTRRQLLEYRLAFDPHRVLLVDAEAEEIMEVCFPRASVQ